MTRPAATYAGMPVVIEPVAGGPRRVIWIFDHADTAFVLACGGRFPRLGSIQPLARLVPPDDECDEGDVA